jgi:nicotinamidase-related amidase
MRITLDNSVLMVVDIQERLFPHMAESEELLKNLVILFKALSILDMPKVVNEQYKKGIGETISELVEALGGIEGFEKTTFSCCANIKVLDEIKKIDRKFVILAGIESHVCMLQTTLDLLDEGFIPVVIEDCTSSRKLNDKKVAIERMRQSGAIITTYESILFELLKDAKHPNFKEISKLIK